MSRSGYTYDCENLGIWRGAVASAIRGRRGQAFLRELLEALDAMPKKRLIAHEFEKEGEVCVLGALGRQRGLDMSGDPEDYTATAYQFGQSEALMREIMYENDECYGGPSMGTKTMDEERFDRMRSWVDREIREPKGQGAHTEER